MAGLATEEVGFESFSGAQRPVPPFKPPKGPRVVRNGPMALEAEEVCRYTESWNSLSTEDLGTGLCRINDCEAEPESVQVSQRADYLKTDCVKGHGELREHAYHFSSSFRCFTLFPCDALSC